MGDPKKTRKKYQTPRHPWLKSRIDAERDILKEYGIKNKREIWKMEAVMRNFSERAKKSIGAKTAQAEKEREQLLLKIRSLGLVSAEAGLDNVLGLTLRDVLERRLQTLVYKKSLAKTTKQARQFIVHGHVKVGEKKMTSPSYLVPAKEEGFITISSTSPLNDPEHPERVIQSESAARKKAEKEEKEKKNRQEGGRYKKYGRRSRENKRPQRNKEEKKGSEK